MNYMDYWSTKTNPETGAKFEHFRLYMECTHNGNADVPTLLASDYGKELTRLLELRFRFEEKDPMGPEYLEYYQSIGIRKQMFETDDFFTRWALFTPRELEEGRKYPLIVWHHGGKESIEDEEFITHLIPMAATEKFTVLMAQNTNWDNIERLIDLVGENIPLDKERVYMGGFSQGSRVTGAAMLRMPERLAAAALNGGPVFDITDNFSAPYTLAEVERLTAAFVPYMQLQNQCDVSNCVPLNHYETRRETPHIDNHYYINPGYDRMKDPTYLPDGITHERINPPQNYDVHYWLMDLLNLRMATLGCAFRDAETCIGYRDTPEDELHHVVGCYGDRERIEELYGVKHYMIDIFNRDGIDAFRYIVVANTNHWPPVTTGELIWDFFKQFRRDSATGKIVADEYKV